ncbi:MAG: hypothetical protein AAF721_26135 [Myxococcota bacterium]
MVSSRWLAATMLIAAGCPTPPASTDVAPTIATAAAEAGPLEVYEELEALIAEGNDSEDDRQYALDRVQKIEDDETAEYAFVRAALLGRVAELRGVKAGKLVTEVERYARMSIERDPEYRDRAATRMLGSLYVMAPPRLVEHGDSEEGLELLEVLAEEKPQLVVNHLRLAEAFIHLGDPEPALEHLCTAQQGRDALRPDEAALLDRLVADVGGAGVLGCAAGVADA